VEELRKLCESPFEREMYDELTQRGYWVTPQVHVGQYRIDMVVEGHNDARLAIECDGDKYHGADKWADDMQRQRVLERAGWVFWRCFASAFVRRRKDMLDDLVKTLAERGIEPMGTEGAPRSVHTEHRVVSSVSRPASQADAWPAEDPVGVEPPTEPLPQPREGLRPPATDGDPPGREPQPTLRIGLQYAGLPFDDYMEYSGPPWNDPRGVSTSAISEGIVRIVEAEGPVIAKRVYDIYLRGCGIRRMGHELKSTMNKALAHALRQGCLASENEVAESGLLFSVVRVNGSPPIKLRTRGPRSLEEIPPSELQVVAKYLVERHGFSSGSDEHLRAILECFDLKRLTTQVGKTLCEILKRSFPYVDEFINRIPK